MALWLNEMAKIMASMAKIAQHRARHRWRKDESEESRKLAWQLAKAWRNDIIEMASSVKIMAGERKLSMWRRMKAEEKHRKPMAK
jgi:hypothetical protein